MEGCGGWKKREHGYVRAGAVGLAAVGVDGDSDSLWDIGEVSIKPQDSASSTHSEHDCLVLNYSWVQVNLLSTPRGECCSFMYPQCMPLLIPHQLSELSQQCSYQLWL